MSNTAEIISPTEKPAKYRPTFKPKAKGTLCKTTMQAVKLAAEYDVPPDEAYQVITGRKPHETTLKRMEEKIERWSLRHPQSVKTASKSIQKFAAGKEVNGIKPKDSTVLAASQRIVDAVDPVVRKSVNINASIDVDPVDLSQFRF